MRNYTIINLAGKSFSAEIYFDHGCREAVWHLKMDFDTPGSFVKFPWEKLPNGVMRVESKRVQTRVKYYGGYFWAEDFDEVKKEALAQKWKFQHPIAARIRCLAEEREIHERWSREYREKAKRDPSIVILSLCWSAKKQSWQASQIEGDYMVVYTVNERNPRPDKLRKGNYYCEITKYNAFHQKSVAGKRGFKLHVISPILPVYNTDSEIARLMPQSEISNPLK